MQQEICARGADSDELPGDQIATMAEGEKRTLRYWRLDASGHSKATGATRGTEYRCRSPRKHGVGR